MGYPEIIILDEPTVGLDPKQIIEIRDLIKRLGEKHTVILSSHILTEISEVCDHVFIISKGRLVASDSTKNLVGMMSGAQEILLTLRGDGQKARELLEDVEDIERVEECNEHVQDIERAEKYNENEEAGPASEKASIQPVITVETGVPTEIPQETSMKVYAKKDTDVRERVFRIMAENQIPVLEMRTVTKSLEDVFLEITTDGGQKTC